jgi:hypothetical protein
LRADRHRWRVGSPYVTAYLGLLGVYILYRAFRDRGEYRGFRAVFAAPLGGFVDSIGGGGWAPIVTSTPLAGFVVRVLPPKRLMLLVGGLVLLVRPTRPGRSSPRTRPLVP